MPVTNKKKELIAHSVIKVLYSRFSTFPEDSANNRNAPFHVAFLKAFKSKLNGRVKDIPDYICLSSWMHGLNTSLGQSFFESVAHILCDGEKRDFKGKQIYTKQVAAIADIMIDLKNGIETPSLKKEDQIIMDMANGELQQASNFTADCFFEIDNEIVAIELKSVRPNSGEMRGEKQKVLQSKAVLKRLYSQKDVKYFFGFPFDPTANTDTGYDKMRFLKYLVEAEKFLDKEELLIADELWSYLAGSDNTMDDILHIINTIATPEFMDKYDKIQSITPQNMAQNKNLLEEWFLFSELEILDKALTIKDVSMRKILNQRIFKTDGSYNDRRFRLL